MISLSPVDRVTVTTLVDNTSDALLPDESLVRRWGLVGSNGPLPVLPTDVAEDGLTFDFLRAEHGFSALVEVDVGTRQRRVLYDAGVSLDGLVSNLDRLAIDPATFESIVLSHGHFDHVMGLHGLARRLGARAMPIVLHPDCWNRRRIVGPDRLFELPTPSRAALEDVGYAVVEARQPSFLLDGMLLVTGAVDRVTDFEQGVPGQEVWRAGAWAPDPLTHDDQALVLNVRGRGLVVLTGCGHAGIVNIVRHAQRLTDVTRVHAVLGGLHLRSGQAVTASVEALAGLAPTLVMPGHCTSWSAHQALATGLPHAYRPGSVGSSVHL
jgi:7,8-dihydropterin-6-yl-methyl-4-(beta-D-ribofuranosyl)aminobenzene 5'-phosphate synthase